MLPDVQKLVHTCLFRDGCWHAAAAVHAFTPLYHAHAVRALKASRCRQMPSFVTPNDPDSEQTRWLACWLVCISCVHVYSRVPPANSHLRILRVFVSYLLALLKCPSNSYKGCPLLIQAY